MARLPNVLNYHLVQEQSVRILAPKTHFRTLSVSPSDSIIIASPACIAGACTDVYARYLILPERHNGTVLTIAPPNLLRLEIARYQSKHCQA